jgi:hypothetical protein
MNSIQVRGYTVSNAAGYLRKAVGEQEAKRIFDGFSPQLQQAVVSAKPAGWLPVSCVAELYRAVAALGGGDEERARKELVSCGRFTANEATNTFLKLLMKMLTPALFAKKLPDLWSRDATGGKYVAEVYEDKIVCRLFEMGGFDHIAPVSLGYVQFALEAMGKTVARTALHGWSLDMPVADGSSFELVWKA